MLPYFWPKTFVLVEFFLIELQAAETMIDKVRMYPSKSSFTDFLSASELSFGLHTDAWVSRSQRNLIF